MNKKALLIPTALTLVMVASGCKGSAAAQVDPCQVNPTYQAVDGVWYEADGEVMDADPCDADDLEEDAFGHKKPVNKPKVNKTAKPSPKKKR